MRVFMTGATGFIGQALATTVLGRGWQLEALVRRPETPASRWLAAQGAALVPGDVLQPEAARDAMARADLLIHNAGVYEYGADAALRARMTEVNVEGTRRVLGLARDLKVPRSVYVSTTWALGATGREPCDEQHVRSAPFVSAYEQSKAQAHDVALRTRGEGLPLVIVMPNGVVGANDHSVLGYLVRLYLMHLLPPLAWSPDSIYSFVDVGALTEGIALAGERAPPGADYLLCGEPTSIREVFALWRPHRGGFAPGLWLPTWAMKLQFAPVEPLLRAAGLPAFLSRETVEVGAVSLNYSAAKARAELGWSHPGAREMWDRTLERERELLATPGRHGLRAKLRPLEAPPSPAPAAGPRRTGDHGAMSSH
jgi:dihydroflavonol-4-reductase